MVGSREAASRTMRPDCGLILRDAAKTPLLRMRVGRHTFTKGTSILGRRSSHSGTGSFFSRMNCGLNSFD
jgi:hypothetical protein